MLTNPVPSYLPPRNDRLNVAEDSHLRWKEPSISEKRTETHEMSLKPQGLQWKIQFALSWYRHPNVSGSISICNIDECDHSYHSRVFLCDSFTVQMLFYSRGNLDLKGKNSIPRKWGLEPPSLTGTLSDDICYVLVLWPHHLSKRKPFWTQ